MQKVFTDKHIGEKVHCSKNGNGTITKVKEHYTCPIVVEFDESLSFNETPAKTLESYTTDGRHENGSEVTLSFGHKHKFDYGRPKFKYKSLKFDGTPTWCWVGIKKTDIEDSKNLRLVIAKDCSLYLAIDKGYSNTESTCTYKWHYAMALTDYELEERGLK